MIEVKVCGLKTAEMVQVALDAGADFIGFVFVPKSPRFIEIEAAEPLIKQVQSTGAQAVGLWQGAGSLALDEVLSSGIDILQAHGTDPGAVELPVWFASGVSCAGDLPRAAQPFDRLLFDAKPPKDAAYVGGHGAAFDWTILRDWYAPQPWMLAGGLNPSNVADAIAISGASAVDVSSGVERAKGEKDADLIRAFIRNAKAASG